MSIAFNIEMFKSNQDTRNLAVKYLRAGSLVAVKCNNTVVIGNLRTKADSRLPTSTMPEASLHLKIPHIRVHLACTLPLSPHTTEIQRYPKSVHRSDISPPFIIFLPFSQSLNLHRPCLNEAHSEAEAVAVVEAAAARASRKVAVVAVHRRSPKRKTSWTSTSTWTRRFK